MFHHKILKEFLQEELLFHFFSLIRIRYNCFANFQLNTNNLELLNLYFHYKSFIIFHTFQIARQYSYIIIEILDVDHSTVS